MALGGKCRRGYDFGMRVRTLTFFAVAGLTFPFAGSAVEVRDFSDLRVVDQSPGATANVSLGDLDRDGDLDMVLAKGRHNVAVDRVLINGGGGRWAASDLGTAKDPSYSALLADIDGDADLDVIVTNETEQGRIYLNRGNGTFTPGELWGSATWNARFAATADFDGDSWIDVVVASRVAEPGRRSHVCLNNRAASFGQCRELNVGRASTIVPADFDRDGTMDLAVLERDGGQSVLVHNDGKAGFNRIRPFGPNTMSARTGASADLNRDGWPDLVVGDERVSAFVHLNDGKGALQVGLQLKFDGLPTPYSMAIGDLNNDQSPDIVIGYGTDRGSVLFNDGTGRSYRHVRFGDADAAVYGLALGDIDGDGFKDIVAARNNSPTVVYLNRPGQGVDVVKASDSVESPRASLRAARIEDYPGGVWKGLATHTYGQKWDVELRLQDLVQGQLAGTLLNLSNGVAYCSAALRLLTYEPGKTATLRAAGCAESTILVTVRWTRADRMEVQGEVEGSGPNQKWTAVLDKRR